VETDDELEELLRSGRGMIATEEFVREVLGKRMDGEEPEASSFRSVLMPVSVQRVMETVLEVLGVDRSYVASRRGSAWARGVAAEMLCTYAGLTQAAAARELGMGTGASVSIRRKALAEQRSKDRKLDRLLRGLEKDLAGRLAGL
jgi:hypothetical protein